MNKHIGIWMILAMVAGVAMFVFFPGSDREPAPAGLPEQAPAKAPSLPEPPAAPGRPSAGDGEDAEAVYSRFEHEPVIEDLLGEGELVEIPVSEEGFDAMPELSPSAQLSRTLVQLQNDTLVTLDEYGRTMLVSTSATLRAMGGILMFKAEAMDDAILRQIAEDADESVPFLVLEWIRDYGTAELAGQLSALLVARGIGTDRLAEDLLSGRFSVGGGRVVVDYLADQLPERERWEELETVAGSPEADYDVRMRAILRLGAEPDAARYRETLERLQAAAAEEGEDWEESMQRLSERMMDDEGESLAARGAVSTRDLNLILGNEHVFTVRDLALYLEDRLLAPGVVVEPGCADMVAAFLKEYPESERDWNVEDEEALDRLEVLRERLVAREAPEEASPESPE